MCGIVAAIANRNVTSMLIEGLRQLEYRGYDSAGFAVLNAEQTIVGHRAVGRVQALDDLNKDKPLDGHIGIAHTRWATHGPAVLKNTHPHVSNNSVCVVHNGVIENHQALKKECEALGYSFLSDTDTEVVAHLVHYAYSKEPHLVKAVQSVLKKLKGAYAIGVMHVDVPGTLVGARVGCPLLVGLSQHAKFLASDKMALAAVADEYMPLSEGDLVSLTQEQVTVYDSQGMVVARSVEPCLDLEEAASKSGHEHFMHKEMHEQPHAIAATIDAFFEGNDLRPKWLELAQSEALQNIKHIFLVACGTSYHAALVAKYWFEKELSIPCTVDVASEFRYRTPVVLPDSLFIAISQSGETLDTLEALRFAKTLGFKTTLCICNVPQSSITREADIALLTHAGAEIGVASTKAFTTQLVVLAICLSMLRPDKTVHVVQSLRTLPSMIEAALSLEASIEGLAEDMQHAKHILFIGRGMLFPIALEGALKLKEISYIHADAYPAGELKHGPLALIEKGMPVVALVSNDALQSKMLANIQEAAARGAHCYLFSDHALQMPDIPRLQCVTLPFTLNDTSSPIALTVPLQLLAYHVAKLKGHDIDKPRNLAKSVTVE